MNKNPTTITTEVEGLQISISLIMNMIKSKNVIVTSDTMDI